MQEFREAVKTSVDPIDVSVSSVIPKYAYLLDTCKNMMETTADEDILHTVAKLALDKLHNQFELTSDLFLVAIILDPRMNLEYFAQDQTSKGREIEEKANNAFLLTYHEYERNLPLALSSANTSVMNLRMKRSQIDT